MGNGGRADRRRTSVVHERRELPLELRNGITHRMSANRFGPECRGIESRECGLESTHGLRAEELPGLGFHHGVERATAGKRDHRPARGHCLYRRYPKVLLTREEKGTA